MMSTYVKKGRCCVCGQRKTLMYLTSASALPRPQYMNFVTPFLCKQCLREIMHIETCKILEHCCYHNQLSMS
jgi:hypothetical protein